MEIRELMKRNDNLMNNLIWMNEFILMSILIVIFIVHYLKFGHIKDGGVMGRKYFIIDVDIDCRL